MSRKWSTKSKKHLGIAIADDSADKIRKISDTVDFIAARLNASDGLTVEER